MATNITLSSEQLHKWFSFENPEYQRKLDEYPILNDSAPIFIGVRGSVAQGLNTSDSDTDWVTILFNPMWLIWPDAGVDTVEDEDRDHLFWSITRFIHLLEKGDINAVETAHIQKSSCWDDAKWIFMNPEAFITKRFLTSVSGFIFNQMKDASKLERVKMNKMVMHALRVAKMTIQMLKETKAAGKVKPLTLNRAGIDADELLAIKIQPEDKQLPFADMKAKVDAAKAELDALIQDPDIQRIIPDVMDPATRVQLRALPMQLLYETTRFSKKSIAELSKKVCVALPFGKKTK
jgi:predicted nucleotidyltransferase